MGGATDYLVPAATGGEIAPMTTVVTAAAAVSLADASVPTVTRAKAQDGGAMGERYPSSDYEHRIDQERGDRGRRSRGRRSSISRDHRQRHSHGRGQESQAPHLRSRNKDR